MQKEELSENKYWRDLLHICSSQTCGFIYWRSSTKETSNTKEHWWRFRGSTNTMMEKFICAIWQKQKYHPNFGYNPNQIPPWRKKKPSVHSLLLVLNKATVLIHGNLIQATVQMGVLILSLLILINPTLKCHMMTHS